MPEPGKSEVLAIDVWSVAALRIWHNVGKWHNFSEKWHNSFSDGTIWRPPIYPNFFIAFSEVLVHFNFLPKIWKWHNVQGVTVRKSVRAHLGWVGHFHAHSAFSYVEKNALLGWVFSHCAWKSGQHFFLHIVKMEYLSMLWTYLCKIVDYFVFFSY